MAFAVLPHIRSCGHNTAFDTAYDKMVKNGFTEDQAGDILSILQSHYNCLGLSCDDVGRHEQETSVHPRCSDNLDIAGYAPTNATKTNMVSAAVCPLRRIDGGLADGLTKFKYTNNFVHAVHDHNPPEGNKKCGHHAK